MSSVSLMSANSRPPFIQFFESYVEDREESIKQGRIVQKPSHMVTIRQLGSKDSCEKYVDDWLESLGRNRDYPREWVDMFTRAYSQWKADHSLDTPVNGTHVKLWPALNKPQVDLLLAVGCRTIEDLAQGNEQLLGRIGMGARDLQNRARAWLEAANNTGKVAEEVVALRVGLEEARERNKALEVKLLALAAGRNIQEPRTVTPQDDFT